MHSTSPLAAIILALLCCAGAVPARAADSFGDWLASKPEAHGFNSARLEALWADLQARHTTAFLLIRNDEIVFEKYAAGFNRAKPHYTASLAKALVGGMSLMLAMDEQRMEPDDLASHYIPQWLDDPRKRAITIRHLATHTAGIEDAEEEDTPHGQLAGWKGDFWKRLPPPRDPFTLARDAAPMLEPPGTKERYSNPGMAMLSYCITAALKGSPHTDLQSLLQERLMEPLGVPSEEWSVGYGVAPQVDGLPLVATWGGGAFSANALARVGRLLLHGGHWAGRQLIARPVVEQATAWAGMPAHSGLGWWGNRNPDGSSFWSCLPPEAFYGAGAGHQLLLVVPSLDLIAVRSGDALDAELGFDEALDRHLVSPLMACLERDEPPSRSPVIQEIQWAPTNTIIRRAPGSDNWPMTWADDGALYTAYGDGNGFEPYLPGKFSLGFARVSGTPPEFAGLNIRSPTGEQLGDGSRGRKASGMLMVEGRLFLWARNAANSQLAWSSDHAASWTWSDWRFTNSFGCPTFLNFGRNYGQARDNYVYVFSLDADTAYEPRGPTGTGPCA